MSLLSERQIRIAQFCALNNK